MNWLDEAIQQLASKPICGYADGATPSVEPTALAAMALLAADRKQEAASSLDWLVGAQSSDGSLGVNVETPSPCWPTGWAIQAWCIAKQNIVPPKPEWADATRTAVEWVLAMSGNVTTQRTPGQRDMVAHDFSLRGWPWVKGTHSWVEPTAIDLLALDATGYFSHPRYREAVEMLLNRQLPRGGWNYGNTVVLGHVLMPHIQPTGLTLAALAHEQGISKLVNASLDYLRRSLSDHTTMSSLCFGLVGLAAFGQWPKAAEKWLAAAYARTVADPKAVIGRCSPYFTAMAILAAKLCEKRIALSALWSEQKKQAEKEIGGSRSANVADK